MLGQNEHPANSREETTHGRLVKLEQPDYGDRKRSKTKSGERGKKVV